MSIQFVNGFACRNCTDIDYAKKHIDPAHPKDGPYGINAPNPPPDPFSPDAAAKAAAKPLSQSRPNGLDIRV